MLIDKITEAKQTWDQFIKSLWYIEYNKII
jgi:hypothetical protein